MQFTSQSKWDYGWMRGNGYNSGVMSMGYYGPPHSAWYSAGIALATYWLWRIVMVGGLLGVASG